VLVPDQPLDLTSTEVTCRLLRDPRAWRERAVESLHVGSAQFIRRERSLQCRPLYPVVADLLPASAVPSSRAFVVLPLAVLPKQPLLEFGVEGPHGSAQLLRRPDIADRETALIASYANEAGLGLPAGLDILLPRLLAFTEGSWEAIRADTARGADPVAAYLDRGLDVPPTPQQRARLRVASVTTTGILEPYSDRSHRHVSAPERPLLVVPELVEDGYVPDVESAVLLIEQYAAFLDAAAVLATQAPNAASDLLVVLSDYGHQWELMVLVEVPLDRPFSIVYRHLDPVAVRAWRNTISPVVVIADADSNHVALSVSDPGTRLLNPHARHPRTGDKAEMGSTSRQSNEMHAFYVWEVKVDFRAILSARLDVLRRVVVANVLVGLVVLLLAAALVVRPPATAGELAIVSGPTAAVAGLLLLREPSTLASRLRSRYSAGVVVCVLVLLAVTVWRFTTLPDLP